MYRGVDVREGESLKREKSRQDQGAVGGTGTERAPAAAGERRGLRCQVCTGCGLCPGVAPRRPATAFGGDPEALHVLSHSFLPENLPRAPQNGGNVRLVTADVGTTTVAMLLYGADGAVADRYIAVNPQTVYGADVISRIRAAEEENKAANMRKQMIGVLEQGLARFRRDLGPGERLRMALAANTTMTYLLEGWDTLELGRAPFRASRLDALETEIAEVPCFIFPGISAFVGGDIVAGMYACCMGEQESVTLLIDLGTNGEIVLGNRGRRIACATAAGPAFEGGVNRGVWGADMVSLLAALRREGFLDETGLLAESCFESGVRVGNVHVTQEAVRAVQLAKGAVAAGIRILREKYGITAKQVDRVVLAGGFGYYLNPEDAAEIGLLPKSLADRAVAGGNTALAGALRAGRKLNEKQNEETLKYTGKSGNRGGERSLKQDLAELVRNTEVLNLAWESGFGERYMEATNLQKSD